MNEYSSKVIIAIIDFLGDLIWPAIVLFVTYRFRAYIEALLTRLASLKIAGSEWVFQPATDKEVKTKVDTKSENIKVGPDGFFSSESIRNILLSSGLVAQDDAATEELLIFQTPKQRTWLVATKKYVFVLLDDERTQKSNDFIQTFFEKSKTLPLKFNSRENARTVKFHAEDIWWYYNANLFPTTESLNRAVEQLIKG